MLSFVLLQTILGRSESIALVSVAYLLKAYLKALKAVEVAVIVVVRPKSLSRGRFVPL